MGMLLMSIMVDTISDQSIYDTDKLNVCVYKDFRSVTPQDIRPQLKQRLALASRNKKMALSESNSTRKGGFNSIQYRIAGLTCTQSDK